MRKFLFHKTLYGLFSLLLFWYVLHLFLRSNVIPDPYQTLVVFSRLLKGDLLFHMGASFLRVAAALVISLCLGMPMGLWLGVSKKADRIISPVVYILYPIPKIAFLPILMLLFGLGDVSKIILIITVIIFQILLAVRDAVKEISHQLLLSAKSLGLNAWQRYLHVIIPATLPNLVTSLRIGIGISISVLFFSENFATSYGLGYFIMHAWAILKYKEMFAGIISLSLMGFFLFKGLDWVERRLCPWMMAAKK